MSSGSATTGEATARPALSILSAAHNTESHLAEMIDSVVAQTVSDWELIIVDNGMSDEVVQIVTGYADDPRIRLLRQEYLGLAGGVDAAAELARGAYYAVLASDGRLKPTFCERVTAVLADHPEIDVLCVDALPFLGPADRPPSFRQRCGVTDEPGVEHRTELVDVVRRAALYSTAAIRAAAWHAGGGYAGDTPQVDSLAMCLRMLASGCDLRVLPEQLGGYRLHADNLDHIPADQDEYEASLERAFVQVATRTDDREVLAALRTTLRQQRYDKALRLTRKAMSDSDPTAARFQARLALRHIPALQPAMVLRPALIWTVLRVAPNGIDHVKSAKRRTASLLRSVTNRKR
ncbi:glycosyltransferase family A protein [Pseudonocardia sp. GCM10023141]|uniref:glycosyltransferase family A protein n=1 Tax=Pseudonocardia sp. GCM10023141 TaxID=3252653 RepID=UPI00361A8CF5